MGKVSWQFKAKEYHKVTLHSKPSRKVAATAQERNIRELSRGQGLYRISLGEEYSRVGIGEI